MAYYDFKKTSGGSGIPEGNLIDPWNTANSAYYNIAKKYSYFEIANDKLYTGFEIAVLVQSGYEGISIKVPDFLALEQGKTYKATMKITMDYCNFSNRYRLGIKHLTSQIENPTSSTFNIEADASFLAQNNEQDFEIEFTAGSENYFAILLSDLTMTGNQYPFCRFSKIEFSEVI